jgi:hypothetical protein
MFVNVLELFDLSVFAVPEFDILEWWFTLDEARIFFREAAGKAGTLEVQFQVVAVMEEFFSYYGQVVYEYSLEHDEGLRFDRELAVKEGNNKLTLRQTTVFGTIILTYFKSDENFWDDDESNWNEDGEYEFEYWYLDDPDNYLTGKITP